MTFKIEKGISLPTKAERPGPKSRYPFGQMVAGDSFAFPSKQVGGIRNAMYIYQRRNPPKRFVCYKMEEGFYRLWCIDDGKWCIEAGKRVRTTKRS